MAIEFRVEPGNVVLKKDGIDVLNLDALPVQFFPAADEIVLTGHPVVFDDLLKGNAYSFNVGTIGGSVNGGCKSFITATGQNWGPEGVGDPVEFEDEIIGTVPAGTDLLMVMVKPTRTATPSQINGVTIPVIPEEGDWNNAPSGCLLIEHLFPMARMIEILLDGTDVVLRRRQTVSRGNYTYWAPGNSSATSGWTWGGTYANSGMHILHAIESKGPTFDPSGVAFRRGGASACSLADPTDYSSTYDLDIRILPGRSDIEEEGNSGSALPQIIYQGVVGGNLGGVTDPQTLTGAPFGDPAASRHILVMISATRGVTPQAQVTGVTIGGVSATLLKDHTHALNDGVSVKSRHAGIWIAAVPTGDDGSIVIDWNGTPNAFLVQHYTIYNLQSTTPVATASALGSAGAVSLATAPDGLALAVSALTFNSFNTPAESYNYLLSGIGNLLNITDGFAIWASRGYQRTTGSSLSLDLTVAVGSNEGVLAAVSLR